MNTPETKFEKFEKSNSPNGRPKLQSLKHRQRRLVPRQNPLFCARVDELYSESCGIDFDGLTAGFETIQLCL